MHTARAAFGSLVFFFVAPAMVAGVIPWLLTGWHAGEPAYPTAVRGLGVLLIAAGCLIIVPAFVRFVIEGLGTPAPVAPTERLVVGGLYRYVRNPMYIAVVATIFGQALLLSRPILFAYGIAIFIVFAAFVHWYEEPALTQRFGSEYIAYKEKAPAWVPARPKKEERSP